MPALVVLAGGRSSRFGSSKQTTPVGPRGQWLCEYALEDAARAGFTSAIVVVAPGREQEFTGRLGALADRLRLTIVPQRTGLVPPAVEDAPRTSPWGTVHAVLAARPVIDDTAFAVVNADDYYGPTSYRLAREALERAEFTGEATIVAMRLSDTLSPHGPVTRAICQVAPDGRVSALEEVRGVERRGNVVVTPVGQVRADALVSMNCWALPPGAMTLLADAFVAFAGTPETSADECLLPSVLADYARAGRLTIRVVVSPGPWFGLTHAGDLPWVRDGLRRLDPSA